MKNINILLLTFCVCFLASCSTYQGHFICPDSKGARCTMLSDVDMLVNSGEIETVYCVPNGCRKKCCSRQSQNSNQPKRILPNLYRVELDNSLESNEVYLN